MAISIHHSNAESRSVTQSNSSENAAATNTSPSKVDTKASPSLNLSELSTQFAETYKAGAEKGLEYWNKVVSEAPKLKQVGWKYPSRSQVYESQFSLGVLLAPIGCGGESLEPVYEEVDSDGIDQDPVEDENPDQVPGNNDGVGTVSNLAGNCVNPGDLLSLGMGEYLCVSKSDLALMEIVDSSGDIEDIMLPDIVPGTDGNPDVPVTLSAAAVSGNQAFVGFSPNDGNLTGLPGGLEASGIYVTDLAGSEPTVVSFPEVDLGIPVEIHNPSSSDSQTFVNSFQPNTPVAMAMVNNQVVIVNENRNVDLNDGGALAYSPFSVHTLNPQTGEMGAASVIIGSYQPKAMKVLPGPQRDLLVLAESGVGGEGSGSSLIRLTLSNGTYIKGEEISLTTLMDDFSIAESSNDNLAVYEENGVSYALVGDRDSGRMIKVNLSDGSSSFVSVFNSGSMAALEIHESASGKQAIALSENQAESVRLSDDSISDSPSSISGDPVRNTALNGDELIAVKEDGSYVKITLNDVTEPEEGADGGSDG